MAPPSVPALTDSDRRRRIEDAATELFARDGYAATSVEDIVTAAGVTKPMMYRHFASKQDLCLSLLDRYRVELIGAPLARFEPDAACRRGQIAEMIGAWLDYAADHPAAVRLLFTPIQGDARVRQAQAQMHTRHRGNQEAVLRAFVPGIDPVTVDAAAEFGRMSLVTAALWVIDHPQAPRESLLRLLVMMAEGLLAGAASLAGAAPPAGPG